LNARVVDASASRKLTTMRPRTRATDTESCRARHSVPAAAVRVASSRL
jgi:hypothetical protein